MFEHPTTPTTPSAVEVVGGDVMEVGAVLVLDDDEGSCCCVVLVDGLVVDVRSARALVVRVVRVVSVVVDS